MYEKKNYEELDQNVRGVKEENKKKNYEELDLVELERAAGGRGPVPAGEWGSWQIPIEPGENILEYLMRKKKLKEGYDELIGLR